MAGGAFCTKRAGRRGAVHAVAIRYRAAGQGRAWRREAACGRKGVLQIAERRCMMQRDAGERAGARRVRHGGRGRGGFARGLRAQRASLLRVTGVRQSGVSLEPHMLHMYELTVSLVNYLFDMLLPIYGVLNRVLHCRRMCTKRRP